VRLARLNPALPPPAAPSGSILTQEVPQGFTPGPYDVLVSGEDASAVAVLHNGFIVCAAQALAARLEPVTTPVSDAAWGAGTWRLVVDGDPAFFQPAPRHTARLLLPLLAGAPGATYASGRPAIELRQARPFGPFTVHLSGPDRDSIDALWRTILDQGGIDLPRLDARAYGDLRLAVLPGGGKAAPQRYRYEFEDGRLAAAKAWGAGADLRFAVTALDAQGCGSEAAASLAAATVQAGTTRLVAPQVPRHPTRVTLPAMPHKAHP
jgi:hypothetical protein